MKIQQINPAPIPPPFKPIVITLETQEEVDNLYACYNFAPICDTLGLDSLERLSPFVFDRDLPHRKCMQRFINLPK